MDILWAMREQINNTDQQESWFFYLKKPRFMRGLVLLAGALLRQ
jgi:hypothetical protein